MSDWPEILKYVWPPQIEAHTLMMMSPAVSTRTAQTMTLAQRNNASNYCNIIDTTSKPPPIYSHAAEGEERKSAQADQCNGEERCRKAQRMMVGFVGHRQYAAATQERIRRALVRLSNGYNRTNPKMINALRCNAVLNLEYFLL